MSCVGEIWNMTILRKLAAPSLVRLRLTEQTRIGNFPELQPKFGGRLLNSHNGLASI